MESLNMFDPYELTQEELIQVAFKYISLSHEVTKLREQVIEYSWLKYPDRSGGQFSDWEIHRRGDEFS